MLHNFQQFFEFVKQFIDKVLDIKVVLWVRIMILVALASLIVTLVVPTPLVVSS